MYYDYFRNTLTVSDKELREMFSSIQNYWKFWENVADLTRTPQLRDLINEARAEWIKQTVLK